MGACKVSCGDAKVPTITPSYYSLTIIPFTLIIVGVGGPLKYRGRG
jgi:hypothetical protein